MLSKYNALVFKLKNRFKIVFRKKINWQVIRLKLEFCSEGERSSLLVTAIKEYAKASNFDIALSQNIPG